MWLWQESRERQTQRNVVQDTRTQFTSTRKNKVYLLDLRDAEEEAEKEWWIAAAAYSLPPKMLLWHERTGHLGEQGLRQLAKVSHGIDFKKATNTVCVCPSCIYGAMRKKPHRKPIKPDAISLNWSTLT